VPGILAERSSGQGVPPIFCVSAAIAAVMAFQGTVPLAEKFVGRRVIGMLRRSQTPSASSAASAEDHDRGQNNLKRPMTSATTNIASILIGPCSIGQASVTMQTMLTVLTVLTQTPSSVSDNRM